MTPNAGTAGRNEMMRTQTMDWESWKAELVRIVGDGCGPGGPIVQCGEACWRESYDDGMTPQESWDENLSYGDPE